MPTLLTNVAKMVWSNCPFQLAIWPIESAGSQPLLYGRSDVIAS
jgi:hypothetical protein